MIRFFLSDKKQVCNPSIWKHGDSDSTMTHLSVQRCCLQRPWVCHQRGIRCPQHMTRLATLNQEHVDQQGSSPWQMKG